MQSLVLLGMYFDAVAVFVTSQTLLFRLALVCQSWEITICIKLSEYLGKTAVLPFLPLITPLLPTLDMYKEFIV